MAMVNMCVCELVPVFFVDCVPFSVYETDWCNTNEDFVGAHISGANTGLDVESRSRPAE